jgi:hypothetical protein
VPAENDAGFIRSVPVELDEVSVTDTAAVV